VSLGVGKHVTVLHKTASPYSCFISAGMLYRYSFVLIRRQQFDIVYEKCIVFKVFVCDTSEKYVMEKLYQKISKKCCVLQVPCKKSIQRSGKISNDRLCAGQGTTKHHIVMEEKLDSVCRQWQFRVGCQNSRLRGQQNFQNYDHVKCYTQFQELVSSVFLDPEPVCFLWMQHGNVSSQNTRYGFFKCSS
jgi:hypothetical protein